MVALCALMMSMGTDGIPDTEWNDMDFATFCSTGRVVPLDQHRKARDAFLQAACGDLQPIDRAV
jgi:hypothetical protein